jgi:non-canonical poly(A) RNA polymerase PAPD5/7
VAAFATYSQRVVDATRPPIDAAIEQIARCVAAIWPQARVTRFGSFATGLWLPSSDVDVVVMDVLPASDDAPEVLTSSSSSTDASGASSNSSPSASSTRKAPQLSDVQALEAIANGLRGQSDWVARIDVVRSAKVPVAKLELRGGRRVDISIENSHTRRGVEASELVSAYSASLPELQPIVFVLKQFLREKALNDAFTGGLSSYAVTLMSVFLLQQMHPVEETPSPSATNAGAASKKSKSKQPSVVTPAMTSAQHRRLGEALLEFVEYYGLHFCYANTGISLRPEAFGAYLLMGPMMMMGMMPQLVVDDPVYAAGQHNAAAGAFAIARVVAALENAHYALRFHRPTRFTPTPLCQLLHWSGHATGKPTQTQTQAPSASS